ncbi:BamA/TamA family outer membrane protein [Sphingomonas sp. ID1715]|uniref:autotransporter assembly complex protein TamA n=1 Tax=Sphingomonas sp. ID1715 TaxID=1656898 RepID=UPI00148804F3|nr:BamA/TamA family outer membrane protein [Sphingomonas sp. ID1715]NNM77528.1 BamA/TamA family outer membrane protein [Sphingomonas sp. ID1715]
MTCCSSRRSGAALAVAAYLAAAFSWSCPALAQTASQAEPALDPDSPLDPLPGLDVDWPELPADEGPAEAPVTGTPTEAGTALRYEVRLEGLDVEQTEAVSSQFNALSTLKSSEKTPANVAQIDRRAREDAELLAELLRARGFYDAEVEPRVATDAGRVIVSLAAEPGEQYRFTEVEVRGLETAPDQAQALRDAFGIRKDDPVDAAAVNAGTTALRQRIGQGGFPFAQVPDPQVVVDRESRTATLVLSVDPGGARKYGRIIVPERSLFSARHIGEIARFKPGQPFEASDIEDLRRALIATGLVSTVSVSPQPGATPDTVDVAVRIEPAPPRTIAGELGYGTGEGARAAVSWQHRNFFSPEGGLTLRAVAGTREQTAAASLRRNNFRKRDHVLTADIALSHLDQPGYEARSFLLGAGIERQTNIVFQKKWTWSAAVNLIASNERGAINSTTSTTRRTYLIGALPGMLAYDGSDNLLDPTRGFRLSGRLSPELSLQNGAFGYARLQLDASGYQPVSDRVVLAGRIRLGSIAGAPASRIAPSRRFFAGGGGSVRGFGFQAIGPRDQDNNPTGGRSLAEFGAEARIRFGAFGIVPFLDGGNIYRSALPSFGGLRYGAGLGVRYHSNFGPIRVDVGTPINPQRGDSRVTVFVSLGQAF